MALVKHEKTVKIFPSAPINDLIEPGLTSLSCRALIVALLPPPHLPNQGVIGCKEESLPIFFPTRSVVGPESPVQVIIAAGLTPS